MKTFLWVDETLPEAQKAQVESKLTETRNNWTSFLRNEYTPCYPVEGDTVLIVRKPFQDDIPMVFIGEITASGFDIYDVSLLGGTGPASKRDVAPPSQVEGVEVWEIIKRGSR